MQALNILILDDEKRVREEIEEYLLGNKYATYKAAMPSEAFAIIEKEHIDIAIVDLKLPEMDGIQVLKKIKSKHPKIEVIMISGHGDIHSVIEAMRFGASDYFPKPFRLLDISNAIERTKRFLALQQRLREAETGLSFLSQELHNNIGHRLIGKSQALKNIVSLMQKVAKTDDTTILISGESGTGKEIVARGIHYLSARKKQVFYSVNCSAIPETLFESEFFGHKKGAFTGAAGDQQGWFEISNKGTLFLDEISDMPLSQQAKLLRVLEEKTINKIGSHTQVPVNVRVVAASNRDLESLSENSKFRPDLYHRLSSFIIHIPPLRERREDIPLLTQHFVQQYARKMSKSIKNIDPKIIEMLKSYHFPGNIRELKNLTERAVILCEEESLSVEHFNLSSDKLHKTSQAGRAENVFDLEINEKKLICEALKKSQNNKSKAAALLNISWQSLSRRMEKYGIEN